MDFRSYLSWCCSHPTLLASLPFVLLFVVISSTIYMVLFATRDNEAAHNVEDLHSHSSHVVGDLEKQQLSHEQRDQGRWRRLLAHILPRSHRHKTQTDDGNDVEYQEKTPLICNATTEACPPRYDGWQESAQLSLNWHGSNQLNTSWGWMA